MKGLRSAAVLLLAAWMAGGLQAAGPTPTERAAARVHAQDVADLFREACLAHQANVDAVARWALGQGFVDATRTRSGGEVAEAMKRRGEAGHVFSRGLNDPSVLLIATTNPSNCLVMGLSTVDGPRFRGRAELLSREWPGVAMAPEPVNSMDYDDEVPHRILRYAGVSVQNDYRLTVISPLGTASGTVILGVTVEPRH